MCRVAILLILFCGSLCAEQYGLTIGSADLKSAEALAFGPDGILFVGDSISGAVFAIDIGDSDSTADVSGFNIANFSVLEIDKKVAALLGAAPSEIRFHDLKVNPVSKNIYLAVSRGRGPDAIPVLLRIELDGSIAELDLSAIPHSRVMLPGLAETTAGLPGSRTLAITDLQYTDGKVIVAGLSNEDFSSTLRVVPFPFTSADRGAAVEIYHTSHYVYETNAPVRTMVPYTSNGEQYVLAAYTCTPLVKLRLSDLKDGAQLTGETLAEMGRHSSPLDMILYQKEEHDFLLVANSFGGMLKLSLDGFESYAPVTEYGGNDAQIPMSKASWLKRVVEMDAYDATRAVMLFEQPKGLDLRVMDLP